MKPGLYIMNYHNVSWEDSLISRGLYGTLRPDLFRDHLEWYRRSGDLVSTKDALAQLSAGEPFKRPTFCLWFDDGYTGVRQHALPVCQSYGITAAQSLNSRFVKREEMYYMAKISFLAMTDGLRFLRSRLRKLHPHMPIKFRYWLKEVFSAEIVAVIDEVYRMFTSASFREDAFRLFDDEGGNQCLVNEGWLMTNHSAGHHPIAEHIKEADVLGAFEECGRLICGYHGSDPYWVSPFSYVHPSHLHSIKERATLVQVMDQVNTAETFLDGVLYRFEPGMLRTPQL